MVFDANVQDGVAIPSRDVVRDEDISIREEPHSEPWSRTFSKIDFSLTSRSGSDLIHTLQDVSVTLEDERGVGPVEVFHTVDVAFGSEGRGGAREDDDDRKGEDEEAAFHVNTAGCF